MKRNFKIAMLAGVLALVAVPAMALGTSGNGNGPEYTPAHETPGPAAPLPQKAKAYGRYCQTESKKHVDGQKGTPFSQCVTALAKANHDETVTAREACKKLSKKHVKGVKGTPFSKCIVGVAQMRKDQTQE